MHWKYRLAFGCAIYANVIYVYAYVNVCEHVFRYGHVRSAHDCLSTCVCSTLRTFNGLGTPLVLQQSCGRQCCTNMVFRSISHGTCSRTKTIIGQFVERDRAELNEGVKKRENNKMKGPKRLAGRFLILKSCQI